MKKRKKLLIEKLEDIKRQVSQWHISVKETEEKIAKAEDNLPDGWKGISLIGLPQAGACISDSHFYDEPPEYRELGVQQ